MENKGHEQAKWQIPFFSVWIGQAISLLGSMLVQFALVWWLTQTTDSATVLATATLAAILPGIFIGPVAGALVDRWNRRVVLILADGIIALVAVALVYLYTVDAVQVWHIYVGMFIRAIADGFQWPAMQASTSLMVPEKHLARIAGINQTLRGMMNIVAPPVGALLLSLMPLQGIMVIDIGSAALAITFLFFVHIPQPKSQATDAASEEEESSLWQNMREGWRYVWNWPGLVAGGAIAMVLNFLLNPAFSLLPLLVTNHFQGEAIHLGWLESAWGVGVVLGGLILSVWGGFRRRIFTSLMGIIGMGVGVLIIGLVPGTIFWLALAALFLAGLMNPLANGPLFAIVQAKVAPEMQGRVFSLMFSTSAAMSPLSLVVAGPISDLLGVRIWYVVAGVVCILMGVGAFFVPAIVHLEDNHKEPTAKEALAIDVAPA